MSSTSRDRPSCSADGCARATKARGLCSMHYQRFMSDGLIARKTPLQRFWTGIDAPSGCWIWKNPMNGKCRQYGAISVNDRLVLAHRFAYELFVGPIPPGLTIDHLCRVTACVNPAHLEAISLAENIQRAPKRDHVPTTVCKRGHADRGVAKSGKTFCKECGRISAREYQRKLRARARGEAA